MTTPSITNSSAVKFTFHDGDILTINTTINANLDFDAMPGVAPTGALLYDFNGVTKVIKITGELQNTGTNVLNSGSAITIDEQRKWLESNLAGFQSGATFISNYSSSYNGASWIDSKILFATINFNEDQTKPLSLPFDITFMVGDV